MKNSKINKEEPAESLQSSKVVFVSNLNQIVGCFDIPVKKCCACACKCSNGGKLMSLSRNFHLPTASLTDYEPEVPFEKRHLTSERDHAFEKALKSNR